MPAWSIAAIICSKLTGLSPNLRRHSHLAARPQRNRRACTLRAVARGSRYRRVDCRIPPLLIMISGKLHLSAWKYSYIHEGGTIVEGNATSQSGHIMICDSLCEVRKNDWPNRNYQPKICIQCPPTGI